MKKGVVKRFSEVDSNPLVKPVTQQGIVAALAVSQDMKQLVKIQKDSKQLTEDEILILSLANAELLDAAKNGHLGKLTKAIDSGADLESKDQSNYTALHAASIKGYFNVVKKLLEAGAQVDTLATDDFTALHLAASYGHLDIVKLLTNDKYKANIEAVTTGSGKWMQMTPIVYAHAYKRKDVVQYLITQGASIPLAHSQFDAISRSQYMNNSKLRKEDENNNNNNNKVEDHNNANNNVVKSNISTTSAIIHYNSQDEISSIDVLLTKPSRPAIDFAFKLTGPNLSHRIILLDNEDLDELSEPVDVKPNLGPKTKCNDNNDDDEDNNNSYRPEFNPSKKSRLGVRYKHK